MKAKIEFVFYHDGMNPTRYLPGDELPGDVAVPAEWVEPSEPVREETRAIDSVSPELPGKKLKKVK